MHYTHELMDNLSITAGFEAPQLQIDTTGDANANVQSKAPDSGFNIRWTPDDIGHVQFSTILRSLAVRGGTFGTQNTFGWGLNLAGSLNVSEADTVQFLGVYGEGIGGLGNDSGFDNTDAAFDSDGNIDALPYMSTMGALTHAWTPRWRSTATLGWVKIDNTGLQSTTAYHLTRYGSVNLMYQLFKRFTIGVETLYGFREVRDRSDTKDVIRVDVGMVYSPFD